MQLLKVAVPKASTIPWEHELIAAPKGDSTLKGAKYTRSMSSMQYLTRAVPKGSTIVRERRFNAFPKDGNTNRCEDPEH
jgi:hypothetical protein